MVINIKIYLAQHNIRKIKIFYVVIVMNIHNKLKQLFYVLMILFMMKKIYHIRI